MRAAHAALAAVLLALAGGAIAKPGEKDWIDSPLIGQGNPPPGNTSIYFSAYLDRLIAVEETDYKFSATFFFYMTWTDPDAPAAVANATEDARKPGGDCGRWCENTKIPGDASLCCDSMFIPSLTLRNVFEYPQGRAQPTNIVVRPDGVVSYRTTVRADMYTVLDVSAFPFDTQTLDYHFTINVNTTAGGNINVIPSAAGLRLFTTGAGDDASGWQAKDLEVWVTEEPYPNQFNDPKLKNNVAPSHPDDPAPLVPAAGVDVAAFGSDISTVGITMALVIKRLSLFFGISIILPVVVCTLISMITFFVAPDRIDTRLQICITLFLSLIAIQWIAEGSLPRASYVIPTRSLVILSYCVLLLIAVETIVVYNLVNRHRLRAYHARMRAARDAHAAWARGAAASARGTARLRPSLTLAVSRLPGPGSFARPWGRRAPRDKHDLADVDEAGAASTPGAASASVHPDDMPADLQRGYAAWLAYMTDMCSFCVILAFYVLAAVLIFVVAIKRAPDVCALAGTEDSPACIAKHRRL